jgi:GNAT superfamily N-acetyltransferase
MIRGLPIRYSDGTAYCAVLNDLERETTTMTITVSQEQPDTSDATSLILELEATLDPLYPPASRHGFSVDRLIVEGVAFFVLRDNGIPAGCAGIKLIDAAYGEVKRMYTRPSFRGRGFGARMLDHLAAYTKAHGVGLLRLETGLYQYEAIRLYERVGFYRTTPFGSYTDDPLSLYYEKRLTGA